jgi:four helix bundle protein
MPIRSFEDLTVWQRAVDLAVEVYNLTSAFPDRERFGLTTQLRRAAISVASNIAEGNGRNTTRDYLNFLSHSRGSLFETRSLLIVSSKLHFVDAAKVVTVRELDDEVGRLLSGLRRSLQRRLTPNP